MLDDPATLRGIADRLEFKNRCQDKRDKDQPDHYMYREGSAPWRAWVD